MDPILLRFLERLTALLIGGLAIYLGYRLFQSVPEQRDSAGRVELPWNVSIVVNRVGPGVFFALFGVMAVGLSLTNPLQIKRTGGDAVDHASNPSTPLSASAVAEVSYAMSAPVPTGAAEPDRITRADARALLRREFALLNSLPRMLSKTDGEDAAPGIARIKLALLKPHWGEPDEGFGDYDAFADWVDAGASEPPPAEMPAAVALWRYGAGEP